MITENDLREAIAECQGTRNPDSKTCMKLAAFYTILDHMQENEPLQMPVNQGFSFSAPPVQTEPQEVIDYISKSEFGKAIDGKQPDSVWAIMDELMQTLSLIQPPLYSAVMRKIKEV